MSSWPPKIILHDFRDQTALIHLKFVKCTRASRSLCNYWYGLMNAFSVAGYCGF